MMILDNLNVIIKFQFLFILYPEGEILKDFLGNVNYYNNDRINLLRIEDKDNFEKSHYIYIKHLGRLLNLSHLHKNEENYCPYCNKDVKCDDIKEHVQKCYKLQFNDCSLLKLLERGSFMKFENYKNKLERPFYVVADTEATNETTGLTEENLNEQIKNVKLGEHKCNSCCYYFICTFDESRNYLKCFDGDNSLHEMMLELMQLSEKCVEEMKINEKMIFVKHMSYCCTD